jgi:glycosyltransferase involved in cell wall biosynthesis
MSGESIEVAVLGDKKSVVIVSPAAQSANNGNWHTAARWQSFLQDDFDTEIVLSWPGDEDQAHPNASKNFNAMIALHARRSSASIASWAQMFPKRPLVVVLTGTDLYRDIRTDAAAQRSLELAHTLVVLQEAGLDELPPQHRAKAQVVYQSCPRAAAAQKAQSFTALMVGHLRDEKDPLTYLRAAQHLSQRQGIKLLHIGRNDDAQYQAPLQQTAAANPRYQWLGGLPQHDTWA